MLEEACIMTVPPQFFGPGIDSLQKLWFSNNGIRSLPPEVGKLQQLDSL